MLKKERHSYIIKQINLHNKVLSSDLSIQLKVSEDTIRRDLNELADNKKIIKVHGGALSKSFHFPFEKIETYAVQSKREIAIKAITMISEGMIVLTGGGTTMLEMARLIPDTLEATFFTISPLVALELAEKKLLTVILLGGQLSRSAQINMGSKTISELLDIRVDLCFLGANGINVKEGLSDSDWEVVQVKKAMIRCSARSVIMCISEKLNSVQKMKVCGLSAIDYLITEIKPSDARVYAYQSQMKVL
jgi:DeoR/GlpR family transcriptional regulator of sugar metabolism